MRADEREGVEEALRAASQRLDEVVAAARSAADEIGAEARARLADDVDATSSERAAAELFEALAARAEGLRREAEKLAGILARTAGQLGSTAGGETNGGGNGPEEHAPSKGVRLLVAQMTDAGSGRAEIAERLRQDFGVEDAGEVLDEVLGPRSG